MRVPLGKLRAFALHDLVVHLFHRGVLHRLFEVDLSAVIVFEKDLGEFRRRALRLLRAHAVFGHLVDQRLFDASAVVLVFLLVDLLIEDADIRRGGLLCHILGVLSEGRVFAALLCGLDGESFQRVHTTEINDVFALSVGSDVVHRVGDEIRRRIHERRRQCAEREVIRLLFGTRKIPFAREHCLESRRADVLNDLFETFLRGVDDKLIEKAEQGAGDPVCGRLKPFDEFRLVECLAYEVAAQTFDSTEEVFGRAFPHAEHRGERACLPLVHAAVQKFLITVSRGGESHRGHTGDSTRGLPSHDGGQKDRREHIADRARRVIADLPEGTAEKLIARVREIIPDLL